MTPADSHPVLVAWQLPIEFELFVADLPEDRMTWVDAKRCSFQVRLPQDGYPECEVKGLHEAERW